MAKFGEGDPRWLVEQRTDGRNVNAWHWEERNVTKDAHNRLREAFGQLELTDDHLFHISKVSTLNGEVTFCIRKGKPILIFELDVVFDWSGEISGEKYSGKLKCEEMATDVPCDEWEFKVTSDSKTALAEGVCKVIKEQGIPKIHKASQVFIDQLKQEYSKGTPSLEAQKQASPQSQKQSQQAEAVEKAAKGALTTKMIQVSLEYREPTSVLFDCFTDARRIVAFTQSQANIRPEAGSDFELFSGSVHGTIVELEPTNKLVMKWRHRNWPEGHFSTLTLLFEAKEGGKTLLKLKQQGVPIEDFERTLSGWKTYFWDRMRMVFGFEYKEK